MLARRLSPAAESDEKKSSATRSCGQTHASLSSGQDQGPIPFFASRQQQRRTPTAAANTMPSSIARSTSSSIFDANGGVSGSSGAAPEKSPAATSPRTETAPTRSFDSSSPFSAGSNHHRLDGSSYDGLPPPRSPPSPPSQLRHSSVAGGSGKRRMLLDADVRCADGERLRRADDRIRFSCRLAGPRVVYR